MEAIGLSVLDFLLSPQAQLEAASLVDRVSIEDTSSMLLTLRRQYTPEQAGALLALVRLRAAARDKFPHADQLYFTQAALEQATAYPIARYRAQSLDSVVDGGAVLDLGSGIGGDTLAIAESRPVHAYEQDPLRCALLAANVNALGLTPRVTVHCADWLERLASGGLETGVAAFLDPPRREGGRRLMRLQQTLPSWEPIEQLLKRVAVVCLKTMPGIADEEIPPGAKVEFVSHAGVCKEAMLWLGETIEPGRRAAVHDGTNWHVLESSGQMPPLGELAAGQILYEPDPAVIRAGAFAELCAGFNAHLFDSQIAYLVSDGAVGVDSPFVAAFAATFTIDEVHDYSLKRLNERLRALDIGIVELKKRGVPFEPESLRGKLKLQPGGQAGVVIFTRQGDRRLMLIGRRLSNRVGGV